MADYELNDHDRAEIVKRFFLRYGYIILITLILCAVAMGVQALWQNHQQNRNQAASNAYQALTVSMQNGAKPEVISAGANQIVANYPDTAYASLAQMNLAQIAVTQNNLSLAESTLTADLKNNHSNDLAPIITLRLARVLLAENKATEALKILQDPPKGYVSAYSLLMGDANVQLNNRLAAKDNYQKGLIAAGDTNPLITQLLTERLNHLNVN
jgi:predicted negative regulator of RcsB-dependent stress response